MNIVATDDFGDEGMPGAIIPIALTFLPNGICLVPACYF
jgi:hypothetical protein